MLIMSIGPFMSLHYNLLLLFNNYLYSQELTVWAYPKTLGEISDVIVCCIKDNPEPLLLKISCQGCKPQLEIPKVDGKVAFQFDKVLLHRSLHDVFYHISTICSNNVFQPPARQN